MENTILRNGLKYLYNPMLNTHSVTIGLYIKAGSCYETPNNKGITHLLEHLHFRRIGKHSQEELYYLFEKMGTSLRASTYRDFIKFSAKITPDNLMNCVELFCELIDTYDWSIDEFEKEKRVVINQILEKGDYVSIDGESRKAIYFESPLSEEIMSSVENVKLLSLEKIRSYKREIFSKNNLLFTITGNVTEKISSVIKERLQQTIISQDEIDTRIECPIVFHKRKPDIRIANVEDDGFFDVNISFDIDYDSTSKAYITILNSILGEGIGGRLQMLVRENNTYTSDIYSFVEWYRGFATLNIRFSIATNQFNECFKSIVKEMHDIKSNINIKDIETTLPFYTTNRAFYEDDTEEMNFELSYNSFILETKTEFVQVDYSMEMCNILQNLAKKVFSINNTTVVIVGDEEKVDEKYLYDFLKEM